MKVLSVKTPLVKLGDDIRDIISQSVRSLPEKSVLVVASKIFSFCENMLVEKKTDRPEEKHKLGKQEDENYIDPPVS